MMNRFGFPMAAARILPFIWVGGFTFLGLVSRVRGESPKFKPTDTGVTELPAGMTDIHDIKPLIEPGIDGWLLFGLLAGLILAALLFWCLLYLWRRRKQTEPVSLERLSPDAEALEKLAELEVMDPSRGKRFYFRLSAVLRHYIRRRYGIDAPEMTTEELLPHILGMNLPSALGRGLRVLIVSVDPVKFAGKPAVEEKMRDDLSFVKEFVQVSTTLMTADDTETELPETDV